MPYDLSGIFPAIAKIAGKDKVTGGPAYEDVLDPQTGQVVRKWKMDPYQGSSGFLGIGSRNRAQALNDAIMPELAMQQQRIASANELEQRRIAAQKELANLEAANRMAELDTKNTYETTGRNELAGLQRELEKLKSRLTVKEAAAKSDIQNVGKTGALINKRNKRQYGQADTLRVNTANRQADLENLAAMDPRMDVAYPNARVAELEGIPLKNLVRVNEGESVYMPKSASDVLKGGSKATGSKTLKTTVPPTYDKSGKVTSFGGETTVNNPATLTDISIDPTIAAQAKGLQSMPEGPVSTVFGDMPVAFSASSNLGISPMPAAQQTPQGVTPMQQYAGDIPMQMLMQEIKNKAANVNRWNPIDLSAPIKEDLYTQLAAAIGIQPEQIGSSRFFKSPKSILEQRLKKQDPRTANQIDQIPVDQLNTIATKLLSQDYLKKANTANQAVLSALGMLP